MTGVDHDKEYRALIMLTSLVSSINGKGHSCLPDHNQPYRQVKEKNDPTVQSKYLNSVSTLLVRSVEVNSLLLTTDPQTSNPVILVTKNPDKKDRFFQEADRMETEDLCRIVTVSEVGKSHFNSAVDFSSWKSLFTIPLSFFDYFPFY